MRRIIASFVVLCALGLFCPDPAAAIAITTVPVGNPGNSNDTTGFGGVAYYYRIGTTEVTNAQYVHFLNEKAKSDPLALYSNNMGSNALGGIIRSGSSPNFSYMVKTDMGNKPVNYVTWFDAVRFANWVNNGGGSGDTETGAYTLLHDGSPTPTLTPSNSDSITRNAGATWFLTSENEWYKAAYYDPRTTAQGGPPSDSHYWKYPTNFNTEPVGEVPPGGLNSANYWSANAGAPTDVGAYTMSDSPYGTFDQGGNLWEWNEAYLGDSFRGVRGGSFGYDPLYMQSSSRFINVIGPAGREDNIVGFRLASVPEPSTFALAAFGLAGLAAWGWRRRND